MDIAVYVTKGDFNLANLEREFDQMHLHYRVRYIEDHPEFVRSYGVRHSPNVVIDGQLIFQAQPSEREMQAYIKTRNGCRSRLH